MATGVSSYGAAVQIGESDGVYVDLGCTIGAQLPGPMQQFVDDKCLGQATRGIASIPTFQDLGTMTLNLKYGQDAYSQLLTWMQEEPPRQVYVKITFPKQLDSGGDQQATAAYVKFNAYIQQPSIEFPEDGGRMPINLTLKVNSDFDFTEGSAL